ncbi:basigin-like [Protopterus annectens]|uniref:basigin-like n=1 Tax=Protopterus annectens TaxID=7888 RepID=UPI001CFB0AF0|nr:basigin-like [Protopterus annectens]
MMGFCMVLVTVLSTLFLSRAATASTAGFIKSPLSEVKLLGDDVELHCEVIGKPIPEAQWWFERDESVDTFMQLWDGAWQDRIRINATYRHHATSTLSVFDLTTSDSGTYECRASNDPDRNDLKKSPRIKWIRSQANIIVIGRPEIIADVEMKNVNEAVLFCNLTNPPSEIKEVLWKKGEEVVFTHKEPPFISVTYTISKVDYHSAGEYVCLFETTPPVNATISVKAAPHVTAYKASENGNEGEKVVLICKSSSYPSVMWSWYKSGENVEGAICVA